MFKQEHNDHCKEIAQRLETVQEGNMRKCEECGEMFSLYDEFNGGYTIDPETDEETAVCPSCGHVHEDHPETVDLFEYLEGNTYNIDYKKNSDCINCGRIEDIRGAEIMIAFGGPNIYINTISGDIELKWWNEEGRAAMSNELIDYINEYMLELVSC